MAMKKLGKFLKPEKESTQVFGVPLRKIFERENCPIPSVVAKLVKYIELEGTAKIETLI